MNAREATTDEVWTRAFEEPLQPAFGLRSGQEAGARASPARRRDEAAIESRLIHDMTASQRQRFDAEMSQVRKSEAAGVLFALLLGGLGAHHFYLGRAGLGVRYLAFCWTFIPSLVAICEAFLMPARVRAYNAERARKIASYVFFSSEPD